MRARDLVGRRIVKVHQRRFCPRDRGGLDTELVALELDNGQFLRFIAYESDFEPYVKPIYPGKPIDPKELT